MMDLVVHLLGPDLDVIIEELTSQGRKHHRYHSDMIGFFHVDVFAQIADACVAIIRSLLEEQASAASNSETITAESSVLHPSQLEDVCTAWYAIFTMMRAIMKQGVKMEVKRHQRRAAKKRQDIVDKQERRTSDSTKAMSESSESSENDAGLLGQSSHSSMGRHSQRGKQGMKKGLSPTRGIGRAVSASLEAMRSPPGRSASGIRAGLSLLNADGGGGSSHGKGGKNKSSKLADLSAKNSSSNCPSAAPLSRGIRSSLSMKRMTLSRS